MTDQGLVLATDLDGTFLGGSEVERRALYDGLAANADAMLIFVTGRDVDFIAELVETGAAPRPRYVIGDVGTSVFDGASLKPITDLEAPIAALWDAANDRVMAMLDGEPGLTLQPTAFRHRVSYDYDPALLSPDSAAKVEAAGFDCLISADQYFDVLPRGINKGATLNRLTEMLGIDRDRVLVAGDTMNDLSLFHTGMKGVAVGNSEPRLKAAVQGMANVYCSPAPGAAGISDAISHFKFKWSRDH